MEKLRMQSKSIVEENIDFLAKRYTNCITEAYDEKGRLVRKVDFDLLRQELSSVLEEGKGERYRLDWAGKRQAILTANSPIAKTLRPAREESVNFDTTENLYIEGDNLDVLKLLGYTYQGKVKMIYIDPPYNTGNCFVYNDDFAVDAEEYLLKSNQRDDQGKRLETNRDTDGRFHSDWLTMMFMRLRLAKNLLTDDGIIFINIDDNEQANLKKICDEVFGESNFINCVSIKAKASSGASGGGEDRKLKKNIEYLLIYARSTCFEGFKIVYQKTKLEDYIKVRDDDGKNFAYTSVLVDEGQEEILTTVKAGNGERIQLFKIKNYKVKSVTQLMKEEGLTKIQVYEKYIEKVFTLENAQTSIRDRVIKGAGTEDDFIIAKYVPKSGKNKGKRIGVGFMGKTKRLVSYLRPLCVIEDGTIYKTDKVGTLWDDLSWSSTHLEGEVPFQSGKKPVALLKRIIEMQADERSIILDFFSGSATTAHAVMLLNAEDGGKRKFIMVQIPEKCSEASDAYIEGYKNICEIGKERIRRAGKKIAEENNMKELNLDIGFRVLKLDDSNMREVFYNPRQYDQNMLLGLDSSIKDDRTAEDVLFQVMLDKGVSLSNKIEKHTTANGQQTYYIVRETRFGIINLICCLDKKINADAVKEIAKLNAEYVVFLDSGIKDDATRTNIQQIFDTYSPKTKVEVL